MKNIFPPNANDQWLSLKYRLRPIQIDGREVVITWFYDHEIENAIQRKDGELISLEKAAEIYYDAAYDVGTGCNEEVQALNILGYAHARGYRVNILEYLVGPGAT